MTTGSDRPAVEDEQPGYLSAGDEPAPNGPSSAEPDPKSGTPAEKAKVPGCLGLTAVLLVVVAVLAFLTMMSTLIWPGETRLTAPLLCPDDKPDAFVVRDQYETSEGTSMDFSLYCMGPRGETYEVGWAKPYLILTAAHVALVVGLLVLWFVVAVVVSGTRRRRRARREREAEPGPHMVIS